MIKLFVDMSKEKILAGILLIVLVVAIGCSSKNKVTGSTVATEPDIYEEPKQIEEQNITQVNETQEAEQSTDIQTAETQEANTTPSITEQAKEEPVEFTFSPESIVSKQNNVSISIDNIKYEIKSQYWGKITEITTTVLNKGNMAFKPKVIVLLYDEADLQFSKEERTKPRAEIEFDIEKLNFGEHITKQAIVNIGFDNITLEKKFELLLVDATDPGNKPIVVAEKEFKAQ